MQRTAAGLLLFAFFLASCAELAWRKDGGDNAGLDPDLSACSKLAQERTQRMWGIAPPVSMDPRIGPIGPSAAEIRLQESQAVTLCMKKKGYALVPAGK
jgi:hypothetical protein